MAAELDGEFRVFSNFNEPKLIESAVSDNNFTISDEFRLCRFYDFLVEAVLMGIMCVLGFFGNTISVACLWRDKSKTATQFLLISLEVADTAFLVAVLFIRVLTSLHLYTAALSVLKPAFPYIGKYVYPCAMIAETGTVYLTILVTLNRYVSVCHPYRASQLCSVTHAKKHVLVVIVFSIIYNLPRFFEFEIAHSNRNASETVTRPTSLARNHAYQVAYSSVLYFVLMFCVPLASLVLLNWKLVSAMRRAKKKRANLLQLVIRHSRSDDDITFMLVVVVLVFVICQTPALVTQVLLSTLPMTSRHCPGIIFFYERISDLLIVVNSSTNFLIYCFCSRRFRRIFLQMFCRQKRLSPSYTHQSLNRRSHNYILSLSVNGVNGTSKL